MVTALTGFQDCMELLLPMAAKKLDLSFDIEPNVPSCTYNLLASDFQLIQQYRGDG